MTPQFVHLYTSMPLSNSLTKLIKWTHNWDIQYFHLHRWNLVSELCTIKLPDQFNFDLHNFNTSMRCSVFDRYRNFWGRKLSYPEEVASSTSYTFVFMYPSYVTLHSNTHRQEILKHKFTINLYTTGPKELWYPPPPKKRLVVHLQEMVHCSVAILWMQRSMFATVDLFFIARQP